MSNFSYAMRPNQTFEENQGSIKSLEEQFNEEIDKLDRADSTKIEPGATVSHDELSQELNKVDGMANGLSEDFVNNYNNPDLRVFDADTGKINYPENDGIVEGTEQIFDSLDDFKAEYGADITLTRRGSHDGTFFSVGDISYNEASLAQEEKYFNGKETEYEIDSLPDDCKIVCGEVASWGEVGRSGGGEQFQFAKTDENGEIIRKEDGSIDAYSVSDLEYNGHITRIENPEINSDSNPDEPPSDDLFKDNEQPDADSYVEKIEAVKIY